MRDEQVQQPELTVGEIGLMRPEPRLPAREVERDSARLHDALVPVAVGSEVHAHAREQLVERERLREVVAGAEVESAQLRLELGARGHDHDR